MRLSRFCLGLSFAVSVLHAGEEDVSRNFEAPAIMFVIDDSKSMLLTDPGHNRFKVLESLLDSINAVAPSAKVGAAIFTDRLAFDYRDNPFFQPLFPGDTSQHDSYIPLTSLDSICGDWMKTGLDTLKDLLAIRGDGSLVQQTLRPKERMPLEGGGGADITLGFDAARAALASSTQPKENRYIIFITDGGANVSDEIRLDRESAYEAAIETPTTFTICIDPDTRRPPLTLMRMTGNIRKNGYSAANPLSSAFGIRRPGDELQPLLEKRVLGKILVDQRRAAAALGLGLMQSRSMLRPAFYDDGLPLLLDDNQGLTSVVDRGTAP